VDGFSLMSPNLGEFGQLFQPPLSQFVGYRLAGHRVEYLEPLVYPSSIRPRMIHVSCSAPRAQKPWRDEGRNILARHRSRDKHDSLLSMKTVPAHVPPNLEAEPS
jgi:hypothetical protein